MKSVKIEVPQGYEIDKEKSTFENIVFKEVKSELPKTWEELEELKGYYVTTYCNITPIAGNICKELLNTFATKEQAEASIAHAQLSQLREVYRNGWKPDWTSKIQRKYCIYFLNNKININDFGQLNFFLCFQDSETAHLFLENFKDLIEQAKPLLS